VIKFNNVALYRGALQLFTDVSMVIYQGRKVGLIGANGSGKSSLFQMLLGTLPPERGDLSLAMRLNVAHMAQEVAASGQAALEFVKAGDERLTAVNRAIDKAQVDEDYSRLASLHEQLADIDGYTANARAEQLLVGLGFDETEFSQPYAAFSGGWRIRLNLAQTLMSPSDVLLLDEPTNHLDLDAIVWLSNWITRYPGTLVLISHDREFLDETVDQIASIEHSTITLTNGNYAAYELHKAQRLAEHQASFRKQQLEISHMQDFVRRFRAKASKARQAQSRIKALERMELIAPAHIDTPFSFRFANADRISDPLMQLRDATLGYAGEEGADGDAPVLTDVEMSIHPGDRIGLLGVNGAGKSTLIRTLAGELPLLDGTRNIGLHTEIGYFSQHQVDELELDRSAFSQMQALMHGKREQEIRNFLGGFNFHGDKVLAPVSSFSGGEKARLTLALITALAPNLLLMDEPTNHLDIDMRQALTTALQSYEGALVVISHDRHLLRNTVDELFRVVGGNVHTYDGDLGSYRDEVVKRTSGPNARKTRADPTSEPASKSTRSRSAASDTTSADVKPRGKATRASRKAIRELETRSRTLEVRIARLVKKKDATALAAAALDLGDQAERDRLQDLLREQSSLDNAIADLEEEWLALNEEIDARSTG
jgi:ATP-binding cassette subfamily F protein 3